MLCVSSCCAVVGIVGGVEPYGVASHHHLPHHQKTEAGEDIKISGTQDDCKHTNLDNIVVGFESIFAASFSQWFKNVDKLW
jgi:hypothetical protein